MKVLVLTGIELTDKEIELIQNTDIYKVALNHHATHLKPNARFTADYIVNNLIRIDYLPVYSSRDTKGKLVNVEHSGSSLVDCCRWLKDKEVLLIADNTVHEDWFKNIVKERLGSPNNIYKFTKDGNFNLKHVSLEDFINGNY